MNYIKEKDILVLKAILVSQKNLCHVRENSEAIIVRWPSPVYSQVILELTEMMT